MKIFYEYGNALYVNLTNRCPCDCTFCLRQYSEGVIPGESLWLEHEPTREEIEEAAQAVDFNQYEEIVFCGYGEPTERLDELLHIATLIKSKINKPIRLNTNGLSDLINEKETVLLLAACIDRINISLNAPDSETYLKLCRPVFGEQAYDAMLRFAAACKGCIDDVCFSVVERILDKEQLKRCVELCCSMGIRLRYR